MKSIMLPRCKKELHVQSYLETQTIHIFQAGTTCCTLILKMGQHLCKHYKVVHRPTSLKHELHSTSAHQSSHY